MMWKRLAADEPFGILNQLLGPVGIEAQNWLRTDPWLFVILVNGFVGASFGMIIFTSAIESIPRDLITAAKVDGASTLQTIRDITLPQIKWPLLFVVTYQTLSLLTSFEYILLLTNGGPGLYGTEVWALTAYHRALQTYFGNNQWGYGAAWGFILVIIGIAVAVVYLACVPVPRVGAGAQNRCAIGAEREDSRKNGWVPECPVPVWEFNRLHLARHKHRAHCLGLHMADHRELLESD